MIARGNTQKYYVCQNPNNNICIYVARKILFVMIGSPPLPHPLHHIWIGQSLLGSIRGAKYLTICAQATEKIIAKFLNLFYVALQMAGRLAAPAGNIMAYLLLTYDW